MCNADAAVAILVVEDEELLQTLIQTSLEDGGFQTEIVSSGERAVSLLDADGKYRALMTDINLEGKITGWDVARRARELHPDMPVIYTGAAAEEWHSRGVPNSLLLVKPFAPAQIVTAVSQLLNTAPPMT